MWFQRIELNNKTWNAPDNEKQCHFWKTLENSFLPLRKGEHMIPILTLWQKCCVHCMERIAVWNSRNHTWRGATNVLLQAQCNWHPGWQDNTVSTASLHWKSFSSYFPRANSCQQVGIQEIHSLSEQLGLSLWNPVHVQQHHTSPGTIGSLILTKWYCSVSALLWLPTATDWPAPTNTQSSLLGESGGYFPDVEPSRVLCSICHCPLFWLFANMPPLALDEKVANATVVQEDWSFHGHLETPLTLWRFWPGTKDCSG